jgi:hypothetical protein
MDNIHLIEALSKTSAFNEAGINQLLVAFEKNTCFDSQLDDHLVIRQRLSAYGRFPDAQADYQCLRN